MTTAAPVAPSAAEQVSIRRGCEQLRQTLLREGLPAAAAAVLSARDITCRADIAPPLSSLPPPEILPRMAELSALLSDAIARKIPICVVGDYDADGMTSTALAVDCLSRLGASVTWRIPDRLRHGYGLHAEIAEDAAAAGAGLLLTVDNGTSAHAATARAKQLGLCVCVTDHHLPDGGALPDADCIVNPQCAAEPRLGAETRLGGNLAGVGVAFYAMAALRTRMERSDINMADYLDLVAIGTVADCVRLDSINRTLVGGGLSMLRKGGGRVGLSALFKTASVVRSAFSCRDISYKIAPRINSAGRFQRAELSVELLLAADQKRATALAAELESLNKKRIAIVAAAMENLQADASMPALVIADENIPAGITGILAGRLAEKHNRPTIVFGRSGDIWRGSGRAPAGGWDLHALALAATAAVAPPQAAGGSVLRVGGHRRAIGVSVRTPEPFAQAFIDCCRRAIPPPMERWVDALPPAAELTTEAVSCMEQLVWGEGFSPPQFFAEGGVSNLRCMGDGRHWRFSWEVDGRVFPALAFNRDEPPSSIAAAVFSLSIDARGGAVTAVIADIL